MKDSLCFKREQRIKSRLEFDRLFNLGNKISGVYYTAFFIPRAWSESGGALSRLAVSLPRRLGNAVVRNHAKRLIRESFRHHQFLWETAWDILIFARRDAEPARQRRDLEKIWHLLSEFSTLSG